jgi:hypothetical protein
LLLAACALVAIVIFRLKPEATRLSAEVTGPSSDATGPSPEATGASAEAVPGPGVARRLWLLAALAVLLTLACYLPYAVFTEWAYLRFLLPAFPLVFVSIGALVANALMRLPVPARGIVLLCALTVVCSVNVVNAGGEQAFNLHRYEARYRTAGRYLEPALPVNAAIVTVQQSASAYHYTGRPIVRWDLLPVELDEAVAALRARGRHPVLLVEDWEMTALAARFPRSALARLDWTPRADIGEVTHVRLFDPADRDAPAPPPLDRLP